MPPRKVSTQNTRNAIEIPPIPNHEVTNAEFKNATQFLAHSVANKTISKSQFLQTIMVVKMQLQFETKFVNVLEFKGSKVCQDPHNFIIDASKTLGVM